jgi:hypothetical protein
MIGLVREPISIIAMRLSGRTSESAPLSAQGTL